MCGITQCYLPPDRSDIPALTSAEAGTRLSDLVGWLQIDMVYPPEDGTIQVLTGPEVG